MGETKVMYHIDEEDTPYLVTLPIPPNEITLADFKSILSPALPTFKYFFKSMDDDCVVKEEICDDSRLLPLFKGRVVAWIKDTGGHHRCYSNQGMCRTPEHTHHHQHHHLSCGCESSSMMTSDVDTTSFVDSDDDDEVTSRISTTTDETSVSRLNDKRPKQRRRCHRAPNGPNLSRTSSSSSLTESTMSLNIIKVTLNLDTVNFLGISIVGQSNKDGDGGICVGSIMKGGAVALDGRIEPGDMILQVNDTNFENMSNDEAVQFLREAVQKPGPITLVVTKCWSPNPKGYFTVPRTEPVRPIDPGAWVAHTEAARGNRSSDCCKKRTGF